MADDVQLAQLIATRLCHDLAGPVGAVAAGVELVGDDPAAADAETLALIGASSAAASRKLKFLRTAFGTPATASLGALADAQAAVAGYLAATAGPAGAPALAWPAKAELARAQERIGPGALQMLFNLVILALESLPRCARLDAEINADGGRLRVSVQGPHPSGSAGATPLRNDIVAVVADPVAALPSARSAQALYAVAVARVLGGTLTLAPTATGLSAVFEAAAGPEAALKSGEEIARAPTVG
jgi:histidine phosphotransferase ChpT